ncbi:MAG: ECF-type sigma factor, partial [Steroidobacteraceae bacterium]
MSSDIPSLIAGADAEDPSAAEALFTALYSELHRLAERQLRRQAMPLTISPTTVLHEAYLDLRDRSSLAFPDRGHFMAYAARAMRGLIIDYARRRCAQKRGGAFEITSLAAEIADNTPGTAELCVAATVSDAFANSTADVIVRFTVSGSVAASGSPSTDADGSAGFCYMGPEIAGEDAIAAFADSDAD